MSALSTLGSQATVEEAFCMVKDVVQKRDEKLKQAEEQVTHLERELQRLKIASPTLLVGDVENTTDTTGSAVPASEKSSEGPAALILSTTARNKLMAALGLQKGAGGVLIPAPVEVHGNTDAVASKLVKLVAAALGLKSMSRDVVEACKQVCACSSNTLTTQMRVEQVARLLVASSAGAELYLLVVGSASNRNSTPNACTAFYHIGRDGGVRHVSLCQVLDATHTGLVVTKHALDKDECHWYKAA
jgi:hypothetical protein